MKRAAIIAATILLTPYAWVVASSALYCAMARKWPLFEPPFTQIIAVWPWRHANWLLGVIIYSAALIPGIIMVLCGVLWWRYCRPSRPLYGASRWAGRQDMHRGGMRVDKSPFSR